LHINCHTQAEEKYYFPAEIAALEFSLIDGISRTYHQVIGICKYLKYFSSVQIGPPALDKIKIKYLSIDEYQDFSS